MFPPVCARLQSRRSRTKDGSSAGHIDRVRLVRAYGACVCFRWYIALSGVVQKTAVGGGGGEDVG